jgi:hypothetical protein
MTTKLPAYFEKYFEQKFSDISIQIHDLKLHVNDEIADLRKQMAFFQRVMIGMIIALFSLLVIHIDQFGSGFLASLKKFIGL